MCVMPEQVFYGKKSLPRHFLEMLENENVHFIQSWFSIMVQLRRMCTSCIFSELLRGFPLYPYSSFFPGPTYPCRPDELL